MRQRCYKPWTPITSESVLYTRTGCRACAISTWDIVNPTTTPKGIVMLSFIDIFFLVSATIFAASWIYALGYAQAWTQARDERRAAKKAVKTALRALQ